MSVNEFYITPNNIDLLVGLYQNDETGKWTIPVYGFKTFQYNDYNYVDRDPNFQKKVIKNVYFNLSEKWLYKSSEFRKLLKYFKVDVKNDNVNVSLITNLDDVPHRTPDINTEYRKYIYRYIDKVFINRKVVEKILRNYVKKTDVKWYDLYYNYDILKSLFARKLKTMIADTIYQINDKVVEKKYTKE